MSAASGRGWVLAGSLLFGCGAVLAGDFDKFDGQPGWDNSREIERYTPQGVVPPAPSGGLLNPVLDVPASGMMNSVEPAGQEVARRAELSNRFARAYRQAGSPRIAVFWNRRFSDQLSEWAGSKRSVKTSGNRVASAQYFDDCMAEGSVGVVSARQGGSHLVAAGGEVRYNPDLCFENRQRAAAAPLGGDETQDLYFSTGFLQPFVQQSAKMVDRAAIMRLVQRDQAQASGAALISDYQELETDALRGYADLLVEVLHLADADANSGIGFVVTLKAVNSGQVLATFRSQGAGETDSRKWVATANGFQQPSGASAYDPQRLGEGLGYELMAQLVSLPRWR